MRRVDRYILREISYPALIGLSALTFIAVSRELGRLLELIVRQSATAAEVWAVAGAVIPNVLTFTIPMAVLVGILTGFGRLSSDSETIALRAAGISMSRILAPVLALGVAAWFANLVITAWIAPTMTVRFESLERQIGLRLVPLELPPGVFYEKIPDVTLYAKSSNAGQWHDIMIDDMRKPDEEKIFFATTAVPTLNDADQTIQIKLLNGNSHRIRYNKQHQFESDTFKERTISYALEPGKGGSKTPPLAQISTRTLWQKMQASSATYQERVEFQKRFALPFACIVFVFVGLPLGVSSSRGSKSMGLVMSLILMFLYYLAFMVGTKLASDSNFSPFLGAWIPNIAFLILGMILMARADRLHENYVLQWYRGFKEWLRERTATTKQAGQHLTQWIYSLTHRSKLFRVIDRYVVRAFLFYFLLVLIVFVSLFIVVTVFELLPHIVRNHISTSTVALYFVFLIPQMLVWVIPLTVLLAILISLGTLTKSNEVLAIKAAGVSLYRLSTPLLFMGLFISGALYFMQDFVLPSANQRQDEYLGIIKGGAPKSYKHPNRKWMAGSDNRIYHYSHFDYTKDMFANLSVFSFEPGSFNLREWTFSSSAIWGGNGWILQNAAIHQMSTPGIEAKNTSVPVMIASGLDGPDYFKDEVRTASQMTYGELQKQVEELHRKQFDVTGLKLDLYRKVSFPVVAFIMTLLGIPFSFKTGKKGAFYGIGICIGLGILYWSSFELFNKLGEIKRLSPLVAAWFPNVLFGLSGTWMMLRLKS